MLKKRSVTLKGHATSLALEPEFWSVIDKELSVVGGSLAGLVTSIDERREPDQPLSSACRVWALNRALSAGQD
ncbi:ribbon-helix-helix domain-containing protein [Oceanicaulis alexandrii]|uniref:ribbon-helix-helix domain-containing protein n=1 Tax=Oceanicaulis alexandrii TaxID=153233 RepID=UPI0023522012|nr:ribbon-helix-helix domain-containing protein [Oceanicaulis alexandrii]